MQTEYDDILAGTHVVELTNLPGLATRGSVNLLDAHTGRQYVVSSDDVIKALYNRIERDMTGGALVAWRFSERTIERTAGLNCSVAGETAHIEPLCRHIFACIKRECEGVVGAIIFVVRADGTRLHIAIPNVRLSYADRVQLVGRFGSTFSFEGTNPIAPVAAQFAASDGLYEGSGCYLAATVSQLSAHSVLLPHPTACCARLKNANPDFAPPPPPADAQTLKGALADPQVAFAKQLIDFIVARATTVAWRDLISCLTPLKRDNPFNDGLDGHLLTASYMMLARHYWHEEKLGGENSTTSFESWWRDLMIEYKGREPSTIDLIYRVLVLTRGDHGRQYESLRDKFISAYLLHCIRNLRRAIAPLDIGKALYFLICHRYATPYVSTGGSKTIAQWYEFVDETLDDGAGWAFKWRPTITQHTTRSALLTRLRDIVLKLAEHFRGISVRNAAMESKKGAIILRALSPDAWIDPAKFDEQLLPSECMALVGWLTDAAKIIGGAVVDGHIFQDAMSRMARNSFFSRLNTEPKIVGTLDGVLVLPTRDERPQTLRGFHTWPISCCAPARFVDGDSDPAAHATLKQLKALWTDYFFEQEEDDCVRIADWTLMYLAQALDGNIKAAKLLCLIATGRAGKSFWSALFAETLGLEPGNADTPAGYATSVNNALFATNGRPRDANEHSAALMPVENKRAALVSESVRGRQFASDMLKKFFGQETVSGRNLHEREKTFIIRVAALLVSNNDIEPDSFDTGTRRRIYLYRPKRQYVDDPDPARPHERLADPSFNKDYRGRQSTRDAFFTMLVEAYVRLQRDYAGDFERVPVPAVVRRETTEMLSRYDPIYRFAVARLIVLPRDGPRCVIPQREMCDEYRKWHDGQADKGPDSANLAWKFTKEAPISVLDRFIDDMNAQEYKFVGLRFATDDEMGGLGAALGDGEMYFREHNVL